MADLPSSTTTLSTVSGEQNDHCDDDDDDEEHDNDEHENDEHDDDDDSVGRNRNIWQCLARP